MCYRKLNLLLIAVQVSKSNGGQQLLINPGSHIKLKPGCLGFFIAESAKEVKRANVWCARCHANVSDPEDIRRCGCPHNVKVNATSHLDIHEVMNSNGHPLYYLVTVTMYRGTFQNEYEIEPNIVFSQNLTT